VAAAVRRAADALADAGFKVTELRCLAVAEAIEQRVGLLTPIDPVAD
jgi:hypothetical protein